jgi:DNA-directed RNA polymerase specialized sigma24 family protein
MIDEWDEQQFTWHQAAVEATAAQPTLDIEWLMQNGDPPADTADWDMIETVAQTLTKLPENYRILLQMLFYDRFSYNEITEMCGYSSKSHTWYHVQKALAMLKEELVKNQKVRDRYDGD